MTSRMSWILSSVLSLVFIACGSADETSKRPVIIYTSSSGTNFEFKAFSPISFRFKPESAEEPNTLVSSTSPLAPFQYEAIVEPELNEAKTNATSFVTGIGLSAFDGENKPLRTTLAIVGREYDAKTGNFSSYTRIFADHQGADLAGAQNFSILNTNSPNYLFTGLGLHGSKLTGRHLQIQNLQLQRKTFESIYEDGDALGSATKVALPPGWAAVAVMIKFVPNAPNTQTPFIQDIALYIGQLVHQ